MTHLGVALLFIVCVYFDYNFYNLRHENNDMNFDCLRQMLSLETNIREAYARGSDDEQNFIQNLSLFLCTYLKEHAQLVEKKQDMHDLLMAVSDNYHVRYKVDVII